MGVGRMGKAVICGRRRHTLLTPLCGTGTVHIMSLPHEALWSELPVTRTRTDGRCRQNEQAHRRAHQRETYMSKATTHMMGDVDAPSTLISETNHGEEWLLESNIQHAPRQTTPLHNIAHQTKVRCTAPHFDTHFHTRSYVHTSSHPPDELPTRLQGCYLHRT